MHSPGIRARMYAADSIDERRDEKKKVDFSRKLLRTVAIAARNGESTRLHEINRTSTSVSRIIREGEVGGKGGGWINGAGRCIEEEKRNSVIHRGDSAPQRE